MRYVQALGAPRQWQHSLFAWQQSLFALVQEVLDAHAEDYGYFFRYLRQKVLGILTLKCILSVWVLGEPVNESSNQQQEEVDHGCSYRKTQIATNGS